jgi:hypothetical protein
VGNAEAQRSDTKKKEQGHHFTKVNPEAGEQSRYVISKLDIPSIIQIT